MKRHGAVPGLYGLRLLSAVRPSKQKRSRDMSSSAPSVTDKVASEPSAISSARDTALSASR